MGAAYYIVLDREIAGVDPFVNGKAIARESERLDQVTQRLGLRDLNDFVSANPDELLAIAEELGLELPSAPPPEAWYTAEEGLAWISNLQSRLIDNPHEVGDAEAVLEDLAEYRDLLLAVDF
jgi:hypothetical protein